MVVEVMTDPVTPSIQVQWHRDGHLATCFHAAPELRMV